MGQKQKEKSSIFAGSLALPRLSLLHARMASAAPVAPGRGVRAGWSFVREGHGAGRGLGGERCAVGREGVLGAEQVWPRLAEEGRGAGRAWPRLAGRGVGPSRASPGRGAAPAVASSGSGVQWLEKGRSGLGGRSLAAGEGCGLVGEGRRWEVVRWWLEVAAQEPEARRRWLVFSPSVG